MIENIISNNPNAPVLVIYGSNVHMRNAVLGELSSVDNITVYGTLNEEEGNKKLLSLPKVDLVVIGRAYGLEQRERIKIFVNKNVSNVPIIEAGLLQEQDIMPTIIKLLKK